MGYQLTRPDADQVKFTSSKTGEHVLDTYLESAEKGSRTIGDMLDDLFNPATGALRTLATPAEVADAIAAATSATASASSASSSASSASSSAASALSSKTAAEAAQTATTNLFNQFGDQYLGSKSADPSTDNLGGPLASGNIYWNTTANTLRFYTGSAWVDPQTVATTAASNANSSASAAATSASSASASATSASSSASTATTKASEASASASSAASSASAASTSASSASSSASTATTQATNAAASAASAASAKTAAEDAAASAATLYDNFDDRYLGAKSSNPSVDNDGAALLTGALYFNSASGEMRVYNGSAWVSAYVSATGLLSAANNLSDLANAATARSNLGLVIGADVQAYDATLLKAADIGNAVQAYDAQTAKYNAATPNFTGDLQVGGFSVGTKIVPQNSQSAAYTCVLTDSGKHLLHPSADTTARTFTIPANSSVPYPIGTAITFVNQNGAGTVTIAITSDTMRLAGTGTTGNRTLAANGIATALKITSTEWIISGSGLT